MKQSALQLWFIHPRQADLFSHQTGPLLSSLILLVFSYKQDNASKQTVDQLWKTEFVKSILFCMGICELLKPPKQQKRGQKVCFYLPSVYSINPSAAASTPAPHPSSFFLLSLSSHQLTHNWRLTVAWRSSVCVKSITCSLALITPSC